jgi:hypothetical protein
MSDLKKTVRDTMGAPVPTSLIARVVEGVRYVVTGKEPSWFGSGQPLAPIAQDQTEGRQLDYPVYYNLQTSPRAGEAISFSMLRTLADSYDLIRIVIETRKDQLVKLNWVIQLKQDQARPTPEQKQEIQQLSDFFAYPDQEHSWETWYRMILEDMLVIDAPCLYARLNKGGALYGFEPIDGGTIVRKIDDSGRTPLPPDVAYQQILKGLPAHDYSADELIYVPRNLRTWKLYGYSPVEQVIMTVNIAIRRQIHQMQYYTEGNVPEALIGMPATWTTDQIKSFQVYWDSLMEGNTAMRRHARFIPGDISKNYTPTKAETLKDEYDEWLARVICYAFSVSPSFLVKQQNRATAQSQAEEAKAEGLVPLIKWTENLMTLLLNKYLGKTEYCFVMKDAESMDPGEQAKVDQAYVESGIRSIDEVRADRGWAPTGHTTPMVLTAQGYVPVGATIPQPTDTAKLAKAQKKSPHRY